jgi:hypothetical protein
MTIDFIAFIRQMISIIEDVGKYASVEQEIRALQTRLEQLALE